MLEGALDEYEEIMDDGYDGKYEAFARATKQQWSKLMSDIANGIGCNLGPCGASSVVSGSIAAPTVQMCFWA